MTVIILLSFAGNEDVAGITVFKKALGVDMEKTVGQNTGSIANGTYVADGDVIEIFVENESIPSLKTDRMLVYIRVTDGGSQVYQISLELNHSSGKDFSGNITINTSMDSYSYLGTGRIGLMVGARSGYRVSVVRLEPTMEPMANFYIDDSGPTVQMSINPSDGQVMDGKYYIRPSSDIVLSISDNDPLSDQTHFKTGNNTRYRWDLGAWTNWTGGTIESPASNADHLLEVSAKDVLGHVTVLNETLRKAVFLTSMSILNETLYENKTVFLEDTWVRSSGSLVLYNCTLGFTGDGTTLIVEKGGRFIMNGPGSPITSRISSSGSNYLIRSEIGSSLRIVNTTVNATMNPLSKTMVLYSGSIEKVSIRGLKSKMEVRRGGVDLLDSEIDIAQASGGLLVDLNHTWSQDISDIENLKITGKGAVPLRILNVSVWSNKDVKRTYYAGDKNAIYEFELDRTLWLEPDPYIRVPYFVHSRSDEAVFRVQYYDESAKQWSSLGSVEVKDQTSNHWVDGPAALIDITSTPLIARFRISWNVSDEDMGAAYFQNPSYGALGRAERDLSVSATTWTIVDDDVLGINGLSILNASQTFMEIASSGRIDAFDVDLGARTEISTALTGLLLHDSTVSVRNHTISLHRIDSTGIISFFGAGDDQGVVRIANSTIQSFGNKLKSGITTTGGEPRLSTVYVATARTGITAKALLSVTGANLMDCDIGIDLTMPTSNPDSGTITMSGVRATQFVGVGLQVSGPITSDWELDLSGYTLYSTKTTTWTRSGGIGAITFDLTGNGKVHADLKGDITNGPSHGISVKGLPIGSVVNVTGPSKIESVTLDGIYMSTPVEMNIGALTIKDCGGSGVFTFSDSTVSMTDSEVSACSDGGVVVADSSTFKTTRTTIGDNMKTGVHVGSSSVYEATRSTIEGNEDGMVISAGSTVRLFGSEIKENDMFGIDARDAELVLDRAQSPSKACEISFNGGDGLLMRGGVLDASYVNSRNNTGTGLNLWDVDIVRMTSVTASANEADGMRVHLSSISYLGPDDSYFNMDMCGLHGNMGTGLYMTADPTSIQWAWIGMSNMTLHSNSIFDLYGPGNLAIKWDMFSGDILGSSTVPRGRIMADMEISAHSSVPARITNTDLTFLGLRRGIQLNEETSLILEDVTLSTSKSSDTIFIRALTNSSLSIKSSAIYDLDELSFEGARSILLEDLTIIESPTILINGSSFLLSGCDLTTQEERLLLIEGSKGRIESSIFNGPEDLLSIDGPVDDISIDGCSLMGGGTGLWLNGSYDFFINDTMFFGDDPLIVVNGTVTLLDCDIPLTDIDVRKSGLTVDVGYTLTAYVFDEDGVNIGFDINVTQGSGPTINYDIGHQQDFVFSRGLISYKVSDIGIDSRGSVVSVLISHDRGTYEISFTHDSTREIAVGSYAAPTTTVNFKNTLNAFEDKGLKDGAVDITEWFTDSEDDLPHLQYSAEPLSGGVTPVMDGPVLDIILEKDFNGFARIYLIATDPHGKSIRTTVNINVQPANDLPSASNPRIIVLGKGEVPPSSGDTIQALWDWYDVDGDIEPGDKRIEWWLNGEYVEDYDGETMIQDVEAGQFWNFTIYPADPYSGTSNKYGPAVSSLPVYVRNIAPSIQGVIITPSDPRTDTEITATITGYSDPDSTGLTLHYRWQKRQGAIWAPLSAPDSPVLDPKFFLRGDQIGVDAWVSDGFSISEVRSATVTILNTQPSIVSASMEKYVVDETDEYIKLGNVETTDPDARTVNLVLEWRVNGTQVGTSTDTLYRSVGKWTHPDKVNITLTITPYDDEQAAGDPVTLYIRYQPSDTDGDGKFDDADGNGVNNGADDQDDDGDGYLDVWEEYLGTDPKDKNDRPIDWDLDGYPDGDGTNSQSWMDTDDDNDGIRDALDNFPRDPSRPSDMDKDGIPDDLDNDADGDGVDNEDDDYPLDPERTTKPGRKLSGLEWVLLLVLIAVVLAVGAYGYLAYTGKVKLPTNAPPEIGPDIKAPGKRKKGIAPAMMDLDVLEEEDLENMMVCSECGEIVKESDKRCPHCRSYFESAGSEGSENDTEDVDDFDLEE